MLGYHIIIIYGEKWERKGELKAMLLFDRVRYERKINSADKDEM